MRAFAEALDAVPMALAENSGLSPIETLANIKSRQAKEKNSRLGVDCMQTGSNGEFAFSSIFLSLHPILQSDPIYIIFLCQLVILLFCSSYRSQSSGCP